jgi:hypothetical protein
MADSAVSQNETKVSQNETKRVSHSNLGPFSLLYLLRFGCRLLVACAAAVGLTRASAFAGVFHRAGIDGLFGLKDWVRGFGGTAALAMSAQA